MPFSEFVILKSALLYLGWMLPSISRINPVLLDKIMVQLLALCNYHKIDLYTSQNAFIKNYKP